MIKIKSIFDEKTGNVYSKYKHSKHSNTAEHIGAIVALYSEILEHTNMQSDELIKIINEAFREETKGENENE